MVGEGGGRILKGSCKEKTSIFQATVDLVMKKFFNASTENSNFYSVREEEEEDFAWFEIIFVRNEVEAPCFRTRPGGSFFTKLS